MIHLLQCLCGPERHALMAILYDDEKISSQEARLGLEAMIERAIAAGEIRRRCEICDKDVSRLWFEDGISKEQDWEKAKAKAQATEQEQMLAQDAIKALRRAENN